MKALKVSNNSNDKAKVTKRKSPDLDSDCLYSFKMIPISKTVIIKWAEEVIQYASVAYNKTISAFYRSKGISHGTYYSLLQKHPELKEAHQEAMRMMGERLWGRAVDKDADWSAIKHRLHSYAAEFAYDDTYHAKLKADADLTAHGNKEYIYEKIIEYRERPKDE